MVNTCKCGLIAGKDLPLSCSQTKRVTICHVTEGSLPSPSTNYLECRRRELKYSAGSAVQTRIPPILSFRQEKVVHYRVAHC